MVRCGRWGVDGECVDGEVWMVGYGRCGVDPGMWTVSV